MDPDLSAARTGEPLAEIALGHAAKICGSLDSARIVSAFEEIARGLLGPCRVQIFTFVPDDSGQVASFGPEQGPGGANGHVMEGGLGLGVGFPTVEGPSDGPAAGRVRLLLRAESDEIGVVEVALHRPLTTADLAVLTALSQPLAVAVRNGLVFEKTRRLTFTDDLTALYNSRFMALYLDRELKRCRRTRASLSLLFMDLDGFKAINDTHGHLAGSRTLVEVGAVLEHTVRDADVIIRYGGDEFVILFPETPLSGGLIIAERIRQVIGDSRFLESMGLEARVSASIGIAAYPDCAEDVRGLIASADRAMYQAKALGKDRVVAASPLATS